MVNGLYSVLFLLQFESAEFRSFAELQSCILQVSPCFREFLCRSFFKKLFREFCYCVCFACSPCIVKSMKSDSNCPVCKVPYRRRGM